jgi:phospholipase C
MSRPDRSSALDRVIVIMFQNRSFDNLLGRLYEPGEVASFEGVAGRDLSNPVPDWAAGTVAGTAPGVVPHGIAAGMNTPSPDPGEEYPHVKVTFDEHGGTVNDVFGRMCPGRHES